MTTVEQLPSLDALATGPVAAFELPPTSVVCKEILESVRPLREDEAYRRRFYEDMGVVRTELTAGEALHGHTLYYKDERQQPSGSYKSRGASHAVLQNPAQRYVTNSTGNHGTSLGIAAARAGAEAVVEGTKNMSTAKVGRVEATGATLCNVHPNFRSAELAAINTARQPDTALIPPFGSPDVIAGQCTFGYELVEDLIARGIADKTVIIPVSVAGGGHITGVALPVWEAKQSGRLGPNVHVVAVQPEGTDTMNRALQKLRTGQPPVGLYDHDTQDRDCDALVIGEASLSPQTMAIVNDPEFVRGMYIVPKLDVSYAMDSLEAELGGSVEPAAALGRAFAEHYAAAWSASDKEVTFVLPISGGNKSPETAAAYRKVEREAAQAAFRSLSENYLRRTISVADEVTASRSPRHQPGAVRAVASYALSGATSGFRTGLTEVDRQGPRPLDHLL